MEKYFLPADVLLPKKDIEKWSVIACDQYSSEPEYWKKAEDIVGDSFSSLKIILPEAYLGENDEEKINKVNKTMGEYLEKDIFNLYENTVIYCERTLKNGDVRKGIIGLIDLEDYSYIKGSDSLIRATEETVLERIPPRVNIRKDAIIEIPHIMLLIDDPKKTVIEPLGDSVGNFDKLYDFTLMQNAGSIKGYKVSDSAYEDITKALNVLKDNSQDGLLFAVGDGNHSLASAKECYRQGTGSRYALVEVVNIHDSSLEFEPIYRVLFGAEPEKVIEDFIRYCGEGEPTQKFTCVYGNTEKDIVVKAKGKLSVATLQTFLDGYLKEHPEIKIDYIHGIDSVKQLSKQENCLGFLFEGMEKDELFIAVSQDGSLPRKTFSMGCADDKRFYLEARKIK